MAFNGKYSQANTGSETHFSQGIMGETEFSRMTSVCTHITTFNAGDIVPIYYAEVLPHDTFSIDLDAVIRQNTLLTPTMGNMVVDFYAFFVPNRVVNTSAPFVFGENPNSSWTASPVSFATLVGPGVGRNQTYQIPVGSVADYYGFPTQRPLLASLLQQCNDLKFRGYIEIYNEFFRDQNYQPPIPYSKLNVYEGFLEPRYTFVEWTNGGTNAEAPFDFTLPADTVPDGSAGRGAMQYALYGNSKVASATTPTGASMVSTSAFKAFDPPLKANKMHDYFTSVLPSPQKSPEVFVPASVGDGFPVLPRLNSVFGNVNDLDGYKPSTLPALRWRSSPSGDVFPGGYADLNLTTQTKSDTGLRVTDSTRVSTSGSTGSGPVVVPDNLFAVPSVDGVNISINDLRFASAVQKVYEALGRGGSRYRSYVKSFFAIEVDDPFKDIPTYLGHIRRDLNLYQTAQTSASESGNTPQGNLAAFGYTEANGQLFAPFTAMENGYIHVFCVVRHKNIYSSYFAPDNFRLNMMDFYQPQLANISEQPVYTKYINPFVSDPTQVFGYQEAFAEYRYEPDRVSGYMRPGITDGLSIWNYADDFSSSLTIADADFMKSNSRSVLDRTLAVTSSVAPQLKGQFVFKVDKQRPMPVYSVPGLDII